MPSPRPSSALLLLLALASPARAEVFLAHIDGRHVGTWTVEHDAGYRETLRIRAIQDDKRTTVLESFAVATGGRPGVVDWERRVRAGTLDRIDRGTFEGGRIFRLENGDRMPIGTVPDDVAYPSMRAELVRRVAAGGDARTAFPYFDPGRMRVVPATLAACDVDATLPGAARCVALELAARTGHERWQLDASGRVLRIDTEFAGLPMTLEACRADCDRPVAAPLDIGALMATPSPYPIPRRLAHAKLRYVLVRADGQAPELVRTGEQQVVMDGARAVVTVCATCGTAQAETPESLAPYLRANAWVRSDAPEIRRLAQRIDSQPGRPLERRMQRLGRTVSNKISGAADYLGYADAVKALRSGRGDCTEYAVLLAALARAQGIPARIAVGMAYSNRFAGRKDAFNPHAWVQVYDGTRWVSYDPALDGFDSTHVALAVGTGEPQEVFDAFLQLRRLRIERLGAVVR